MKTLGGFLCVRNTISLDYCFVEAIKSMLPICDQIVISEAESTDGTREFLNNWSKAEHKLKIVNFAWPDPKGDPGFYPFWLNSARKQLDTEWACYLDADEVFHEKSYNLIVNVVKQEKTAMCYRWNFWANAQSLIPVGECCGVNVIRIGPANLDFPSDYPTPESAELSSHAEKTPIAIMHYGFLRRRDAFFEKAKSVQRIWADDYDPRLEAADKAGGNWMENPIVSPWINKLDKFNGTHPLVIHDWLTERGYSL